MNIETDILTNHRKSHKKNIVSKKNFDAVKEGIRHKKYKDRGRQNQEQRLKKKIQKFNSFFVDRWQ